MGRNAASYIDDIVIKSVLESDHIRDLAETFANLRRVGMKLNPAKCMFGGRSGKLLGYLVSKAGIDPNPVKIQAILDMQPPTSIRELQQFTGRVVALSRFISRLAEKSLPFFEILQGPRVFRWTPDHQQAFLELKQCLV